MAKLKKTIKSEIKKYMKENGGAYSKWYAGVATYPRKRLFTEHNVDEKNSCSIYRKATSSNTARKVEEYLVKRLGTDGGTGGGDESTKYVYAYKKASNTKE